MFRILGVAIQAKNNADHASQVVRVYCLMVILLRVGKKHHDIEKSALVRLCSFFKVNKPLQAPSKSRQPCNEITLWTTSGLSEVVAVTARESMCN